MSAPRLLYLVTEDWYFLSHRLPMARAARDAGFEVVVACRVGECGDAIRAEGFRLVPVALSRRGGSPRELLELVRLYRREKPDLVHHVALKCAVFGSLAAWAAGVPAVINAVAGLGYAFIGREIKARVIRAAILGVFRILFGRPNTWLLVQNSDDRAFFADRGIVPASRVVRIPGSGVDADTFPVMPEPDGTPRATLVARMLWDKGVGETVEAARMLRDRGVPLVVTLVGDPDPSNPKSIAEHQLQAWHDQGIVEWWGRRTDIDQVWAQSAIAILPSYREGLPKSLLEAAACGRPMVSTDVPGCRELVSHDGNGLLVPACDSVALAAALERLARDPQLRKRLGAQARADVETTFSATAIGRDVVALYHRAIQGVGAKQ